MAFKIIYDGALTLPPELVRQHDLTIVQPIVIIEGQELLSEVDISLDEFFERQRTAATLPKTSQPAPGQFVAAFEAALQQADQVLCLCISSGLSGTFNSAVQAAATFPEDKVIVHDTLSISGAGGMQVLAAAHVAEQGGSVAEALAAARRTHQETELFFALDDLTYLIKGGRVGRVQGAIGSFLNLKPIITVDKSDGKFQPHSRIRALKAAMKKLVDLATERIGEGQPGRFMVLYGTMDEEAQALAQSVRDRFDVRWLQLNTVSPTLGAHTGPRALGLAFAPGDW